MSALPQNNDALNRAALKWLEQAKGSDPQPHYLHLLSLAAWGLENKVAGEWPDRDRHAVEDPVALMWAWKPANLLAWLLSNPNEDQAEDNMLQALVGASSAKSAAAVVLNQIYSRMEAELPALQPAASKLR